MTGAHQPPQYSYASADHTHSHSYLVPRVQNILAELQPTTVFDLGCGNGSVAHILGSHFQVRGIDASESGIAHANQAYPDLQLEVASAYADLAGRYGQFDVVVSLEVVEHLLDPRLYARRLFELVKPGGAAIVSTPFHGYWKNLALAVTGKMDGHFTALWDGGHIKFWSVRTLRSLLGEAGFEEGRFYFVGRIPQLAKSMICVVRRPQV